MDYTFAMSEFAAESYAFVHGSYRVRVHLHPVFSDPALFEVHRDRDPVVAWIFITHDTAGELVFNAQYDAMMNPPFFLNRHEGAFGENLDDSGRASLWTRDELTTAIRDCLDRLQEPSPPVARRPW
jgi:hypothetical protein